MVLKVPTVVLPATFSLTEVADKAMSVGAEFGKITVNGPTGGVGIGAMSLNV